MLKSRKARWALGIGGTLLAMTLGVASTSSTINVDMAEFMFALSAQTMDAGRITFKVRNLGGSQHDFEVAGKRTQTLARGGTEEITLDLAPGTYVYRCTIPGHAEAGMQGTITVR